MTPKTPLCRPICPFELPVATGVHVMEREPDGPAAAPGWKRAA